MHLRRGFSITELVVAMGIASVVSSMAIMVFLGLQETVLLTANRSEGDQENMMLSEWFVRELQVVGGGPLRPWMSVRVEDNAIGKGSDRLTLVRVDPDHPSCGLSEIASAGVLHLTRADDAATCCLDAAMEGRQVYLVSANGEYWRSLRIESVDDDPAVCTLTPATDGSKLSGSSMSASGLAAELDAVDTSQPDEAFILGTVSPVWVRRYSVNHFKEALILELDVDPTDGSYETQTVADRLYDLQFALGYDPGASGDGVETTGGKDDGWLYNHDDDIFGLDGLGDVATEDLRMIAVGTVMAWPAIEQDRPPGVSVLNGPMRESEDDHLRDQVTMMSLRNRPGFE